MNRDRKIIPIKAERPSSLSAEDRAAIDRAIAEHRNRPGALLPILHAVQDALGYVPKDAVPLIAEGLNRSRAEVHGVLTFYHWYRTEKPGDHVIHLCRAEACQARGARALEAHAKRSLGIDYHQTTADRRTTLEPAYCLGNCALGPALMIDGQLHGRVDAARFDALVGRDAAGPAA